MTDQPKDQLLEATEKAVLKILRHTNKDGDDASQHVSVADRLKAAEIASKIMMVKHRVGGGANDESFFKAGKVA